MTENELARDVVDTAYHIHAKLGPGLPKSVYETVLAFESRKRGLAVTIRPGKPAAFGAHVPGIEDLRAEVLARRSLIEV